MESSASSSSGAESSGSNTRQQQEQQERLRVEHRARLLDTLPREILREIYDEFQAISNKRKNCLERVKKARRLRANARQGCQDAIARRDVLEGQVGFAKSMIADWKKQLFEKQRELRTAKREVDELHNEAAEHERMLQLEAGKYTQLGKQLTKVLEQAQSRAQAGAGGRKVGVGDKRKQPLLAPRVPWPL